MNRHREVIYARRRKALAADSLQEDILDMIRKEVVAMVAAHTDGRTSEIDHSALSEAVGNIFPMSQELAGQVQSAHESEITDLIMDEATTLYEHRGAHFTPPVMRMVERYTYINALDRAWIDHLEAMDSLRNGIGLRAIGQRDPLVEYKREGFRMFKQLVALLDAEVATTIFKVSVTQEAAEAEAPIDTPLTRAAEQASTNLDVDGLQSSANAPSRQERRAKPRPIVAAAVTKKQKKRR